MKRIAVVLTAAALTLSGCGLGNGLYNVPLPGGADLGDHPYSVTIAFADAEDLVPQSGVKVNDVAVGRVSTIGLNRAGTVAEVTVEINGSVHLPADAVASIQQTSLLGEKYVDLAAPAGPSTGRLGNHARIPLSRTTDGVEVEQVFGALSLLLNGGGIGQLHDITHQLNLFAAGHETQLRGFIGGVDRVVGQLNAHRASITRALDALNTLSATLDQQDGHLKTVLTSLAPGIEEIAAQRHQLTGALVALNRLSTTTVHVLDVSSSDTVADLRALAPILDQLVKAGSALPQSLQELLTFPFSDGAVQGIKGDYLNSFVTVVLRTKGGVVYGSTPNVLPAGRVRHGLPAVVATPSGLLPPTSSAASGLPSTLTLTPSDPSSGSGSSSASGSAPGSASGSASGSGSSSAAGSASSSGSGSSSASSSSGGR